MSRAYCLIRGDPVYRHEAFVRGLRATGYDVLSQHHPVRGAPGDVLVMWNRYGGNHEIACAFEKAGGLVLVAENGYVGNDRSNRTIYAISRGGHNGSGSWPLGGPERWAKLGVEMQPWQQGGDHVLVCPNRSFGMPGFIMPPNWPQAVAERLAKHTSRPIRIRPHPGNSPPRKALALDLAGAWAVVIWSSSAGCEALIAGIPVFSEAPWWIASGAAKSDVREIENPRYGDERVRAMERLAWAQWHVEEIESGKPFSHLCDRTSSFAERV